MEIGVAHKIDLHRRLCIKKDLIELSQWIDSLSTLNDELAQLKIIEKQLVKNSSIETKLLAVRRKNTLVMAMLCKYEQELKTEHEYGKTEYNVARAKEHEKKRGLYSDVLQDFQQLKKMIYQVLSTYHRR